MPETEDLVPVRMATLRVDALLTRVHWWVTQGRHLRDVEHKAAVRLQRRRYRAGAVQVVVD